MKMPNVGSKGALLVHYLKIILIKQSSLQIEPTEPTEPT
jgi:hypothetical protein